jgi:ketosteroid isomerase-like protein
MEDGMRVARILMVLLLLGIAAFAMPPQEDANSAVQSKIVALEKVWNQAYKMGDRRSLDALLDDQVVLVNDDGSMQSKPEFLATVKPQSSHQEQVEPVSISVRVFGATAIATGVLRTKGTEGGKPFVHRERFIDTWVHKGEHWVCVGTNATPVLH